MKQASDFEPRVIKLMEASIATKQDLLHSSALVSVVAKVSEVLIRALQQGNKALLFGNGGSAADAQHIAAEFVGRFAFERPALPALALSVNTSCVTAIGNDYGFDQVFSRQIEAIGKVGLHTVGLTGRGGGKLKECVDHCICVPSDETPRIQECHILVGHIISELVEHELFHEQGRVSGS